MSQVSCGETLDFILWSYRIYKHSKTFQVLEEVQLEIPDGFRNYFATLATEQIFQKIVHGNVIHVKLLMAEKNWHK